VFRTRTHVGVFVHDRPGPLARARAIVPELRSQVTVLSHADLDGLDLGDRALRVQLPAPDAERTTPLVEALPLPGTIGPAAAGELVSWIEQESPSLLFVDGPVEVALFARLAGVPVAILRRHGQRSARQAEVVSTSVVGELAPYPEHLEPAGTARPPGTVHTGLLTSHAGRPVDRQAARSQLGLRDEDRLVTVLGGRGGLEVADERLRQTAAAVEGWRWHHLGRDGDDPPDALVRRFGWVDDPWVHLVAADVVVAGASPISVAEVAHAGTPLVVAPRRSDDREERRLADALGAAGAAVPLATWPDPSRWGATLDAAAALDRGRWHELADPGAAVRAAEWLDAWSSVPSTDGFDRPAVTEELDRLLALELAGRSGGPRPG
jgi:UDP-N-acetylglucosamine--N-acetylmuramyl-(pentapeptide) pyrophosphoryl-undecaprenol N-acetylglucosamine transferase